MKLEKTYNDYVHVYNTDLDTKQLTESCEFIRHLILQNTNPAMAGIELGPATTKVFSQYNICLFPFDGFYDVYEVILKAAHNHIEDWSTSWYMQAWLNYYEKDDYIDWHKHFKSDPNSWHGFVCVNCEESHTSYKFEDETQIDIPSKDGNLVIGVSDGDLHRTWPWPHNDRPRITIAFDIVPQKQIDFGVNHWMPIIKKEK